MILDIVRNFDSLFGDHFFNRLPGEFFNDVPGSLSTQPHLKTVDQDDAFIVQASLPGFSKEKVDIEFKDQYLLIKGDNEVKRDEKVRYFIQERRAVKFERSIYIPYGVDTDNISAAFENGVLTVTLPKTEEHKPKKITVL